MADLARLIVEVLSAVWGWVVFFSPIKVTVIEDGNRGARKSFGRFHKATLGPGTYLATSFQGIESGAALACQASPNGRVEAFTKEGVPVDVWAIAPYDVIDYPANARLNDAEELATQVLEAAIVDVFARRTIRQAIGPTASLRSAVKKAMQRRADELALGVTVTGIEITGRKVAEPAVLRALNLGTIETAIGEGGLVAAEATAILAGAIPIVTAEESRP
jgi:regulator of protease activity HflC (stomatin/prohibitin superfamily)